MHTATQAQPWHTQAQRYSSTPTQTVASSEPPCQTVNLNAVTTQTIDLVYKNVCEVNSKLTQLNSRNRTAKLLSLIVLAESLYILNEKDPNGVATKTKEALAPYYQQMLDGIQSMRTIIKGSEKPSIPSRKPDDSQKTESESEDTSKNAESSNKQE